MLSFIVAVSILQVVVRFGRSGSHFCRDGRCRDRYGDLFRFFLGSVVIVVSIILMRPVKKVFAISNLCWFGTNVLFNKPTNTM